MSSTGETYKPSEHGGLKEDGTPDKRMQQTEFAYGKVDPHEAGAQGGKSSGSGNSGGDNYKPTEHDGLTKDGNVDGRTKAGGNTEFAHGKVDPVEAGKKGGQTS